MKLRFTKMQGAGNDFVVLDATQAPLALDAQTLRRLGDRHFGVGADQILVVEKSPAAGVDFAYRIFNNSGDEVEHCGNGARCFVHYVRDKGLSDKRTLRVQTINNLLELRLQPDGGVTVDMNTPIFELPRIPFDPAGATPERVGNAELWPLKLNGQTVWVAVLSMGNPHGRRCRCRAGGHVGPADRTPHQLPAQGQRRLHADRGSWAHPVARV